jgi:hypothetical protein
MTDPIHQQQLNAKLDTLNLNFQKLVNELQIRPRASPNIFLTRMMRRSMAREITIPDSIGSPAFAGGNFGAA